MDLAFSHLLAKNMGITMSSTAIAMENISGKGFH
jgi:hypothetical protein